jgi:hydroxypyruvate reductase
MIHLDTIRAACRKAADAGACIRGNLSLRGHQLRVGHHRLELPPAARIYLVAFGKASVAMSESAVAILGDRLTEGIAAVPRGTGSAAPQRLTYIPAGHPLPDEGSLRAGLAVDQMLANTRGDDLVLVLVSGGGSAMMELPLEGIGLADLHAMNKALLASGAPIQAVNAVRSGISRVKAGGLARLAAPARVISLILSDVIGDRLSTIASGPTILRHHDPQETVAILKALDLWTRVHDPVRQALARPKSRARKAPRPINVLVASSRLTIAAASREAARLGFMTRVVSRRMQGEAREVGTDIAGRMILQVGRLGRAPSHPNLRRPRRGMCLLWAGEPTVTVRGKGKGGRCQELALSAAEALDRMPGVALMAFGTDGVDGPTDAAGAVVTGETARRCREVGINIEAALENNDAYPALDAVHGLVRTGPTGTNLGDLVVGLIYAVP